MRYDTPRGLESPALTVGSILPHVDAPQLSKVQGVDVRDTASHSSQTTLGEGHLRPDQDH